MKEEEWFGLNIEPESEAWVIVKDSEYNVYNNYQYIDGTWYKFTINDDGSEDGSKVDMTNIVLWCYQSN